MVQKLICPSCGAELDPASIEGNSITCPYCRNKLMVAGSAPADAPTPGTDGVNTALIDEIVRLRMAQQSNVQPETSSRVSALKGKVRYYEPALHPDEFEAISQKLFDNDPLLPDDIFHKISFDALKRIYVPVRTVRGRINGMVSWKEDNNFRRQMVAETFEMSTIAAMASSLPKSAVNKLKDFSCDFGENYRTVDEAEFTNVCLPELGYDAETNIATLGTVQAKCTESLRLRYTKRYAGKERGENISNDLAVSFDETVDDEFDYIYVPFYLIRFDYKNSTYYLMGDAVNGNFRIQQLPQDRERKELLNKMLPNWALTAMVLIIVVPPLLWFFGPLTFSWLLKLLIPGVIALAVVGYVGSRQVDAQKKDAVERAINARKR